MNEKQPLLLCFCVCAFTSYTHLLDLFKRLVVSEVPQQSRKMYGVPVL